MLMPAGVLVVLLLGAIAFDLSVVFLRQRQASSLAVDVANDLATAALDEGGVPSRWHVSARSGPGRPARPSRSSGRATCTDEVVDIEVTVLAPDSVEVRLVIAVDYVFAKAIPGASDGTTVEATATAVAVEGG